MSLVNALIWSVRLWVADRLDRISPRRFNRYFAAEIGRWYLAQGYSKRTLRFMMQQRVLPQNSSGPKTPSVGRRRKRSLKSQGMPKTLDI